jgi:hypothetical protein
MKPRSIGVLCVVSMLAATPMVFPQQSTLSQEQKVPSAEAKAEKKPNIVVFKLSGTAKPAKKPELPKGLPHIRSLTNAERLEIARGVQGIPNLINATVAPILTLSPSHMVDPLGQLFLGAPAEDFPASLAFYDLAVLLGNYDQHCEELEVNSREYVQMFFQGEAGDVYIVDFLVVFPQPNQPSLDFQITVSGMDPSFQQVTSPEVPTMPWVAHLTTKPFLVSQSGSYLVVLQLKPKPNNESPQPNWGPWYFFQVDVAKYVPSASPLG